MARTPLGSGNAGDDLLNGGPGRRDRANGGPGVNRCSEVFFSRFC